MWWQIVLGVLVALALVWAGLIIALAIIRPRGQSLTDMMRLLPDALRLVTRLARDRTLPRGVRWRLVLLTAYLASPIDLVPDFIPVIGYADDAILIAVTLRSVIRRAGPAALDRHWPGSPAGLTALQQLLVLPGETNNEP